MAVVLIRTTIVIAAATEPAVIISNFCMTTMVFITIISILCFCSWFMAVIGIVMIVVAGVMMLSVLLLMSIAAAMF